MKHSYVRFLHMPWIVLACCQPRFAFIFMHLLEQKGEVTYISMCTVEHLVHIAAALIRAFVRSQIFIPNITRSTPQTFTTYKTVLCVAHLMAFHY